MSVVATNAYSTFAGNGAATAFPFAFACRNAADLVVYVNGAVQGSGYTVALDSDFNGGTVTFAIAPANGAAIIVASDPSFAQSIAFENAGAYNPAAVDGANDAAAIRDVFLLGLLQRCFLAPIGEVLGALPAKAQRAGLVFGFGADGVTPTAVNPGGADSALRTDLAASTGAGLLGWIASGAGAVARAIRDKLRDRVSAQDFGAVGDGSTDDYAAITAALATGKHVRLPMTASGQYNVSQPIVIGDGMMLTADPAVVLHGSGSTGALVINGSKCHVDVGEVNAPTSPYATRIYNVEFSFVRLRRPGSCTTASIYHDPASQTKNAGNTRFIIGDGQFGSVPYGVKLDSHATWKREGDIWDFVTGLSATTCTLVVGTAGHNTIRWNKFRIGPDAQGITPLLIDVYCDDNDFDMMPWSGQSSPPVAHVRFNAGTVGNFLKAGPGVQGALIVSDLGTNAYDIPDGLGGRILGGIRSFLSKIGYGTGAGGAVVQPTSKSTATPAINKVCGQITMNNAALAAGAKVTFTVPNNLVKSTDFIGVLVSGGGTANAYRAAVTQIVDGVSFSVTIENITGGSLSESPVINFINFGAKAA